MSNITARDVQILPIAPNTTIIRSRTWDRLKFEIEYALQKGTTANSYLIQSDKIALIDPPGESFTAIFLEALQKRIALPHIDYIILGHINPNRCVTIKSLLEIFPNLTFICSNPAAIALKSILENQELPIKVVRGEETLDLGQGHQLLFTPTPTPRWPDQLCSYDKQTKILYTDKFFGAHICHDQVFDEGWTQFNDDRRYYFDCLHAAQARQVESALEKLSTYQQIAFYATGHGPLVKYSLTELTKQYQTWCKEQKTQNLRITLIYASAYGNTATIALALARGVTKAGIAVDSINCEFADPTEIQTSLEKSIGFMIGSPTLGGHAPTQIQTALGIVISSAPKNALAGVFGSFGWSGEAIDLLESKLKDAGFKFGFEPIRVKFKPTEVTIKYCEEVGTDFAQTLKKAQKSRTSTRQNIKGGQSDRTEQAVGRIIGSLCVVSTKQGELSSAMLASWVSQASFNPPGLTVAVAKDRAIESLMYPGSNFVLNILAEGKQLRKHFLKTFSPGEDRFLGLNIDIAKNGCPILKDALAYLECSVESRMEIGDHWLIYATVNNGQVLNPEGITAVHHRKSGIYY